MKNVKKLFVSLICAGLFLTGCSQKEVVYIYADSNSSETTSISVEGIDTSLEPSDSFSSSSEEELVIFNAEDISFAFNTTAALMGYSFSVEYDDIDKFWQAEIPFYELENTSCETSKEVAVFLSKFLPDYIYVWIAGYVDAGEHEDDEYAIVLVNPNISSAIEIYGYLVDSYLTAKIFIYDIY